MITATSGRGLAITTEDKVGTRTIIDVVDEAVVAVGTVVEIGIVAVAIITIILPDQDWSLAANTTACISGETALRIGIARLITGPTKLLFAQDFKARTIKVAAAETMAGDTKEEGTEVAAPIPDMDARDMEVLLTSSIL